MLNPRSVARWHYEWVKGGRTLVRSLVKLFVWPRDTGHWTDEADSGDPRLRCVSPVQRQCQARLTIRGLYECVLGPHSFIHHHLGPL